MARVLILFSSLVFGMIVSADLGERGFTLEEKQRIIDVHNMFRARVAAGEQYGQPKSADMAVLEWDDRLEISAQKWADTCPSAAHAHSDLESRRFYPYLFTGQNFAGSATAQVDASVADWFGEVRHFNYAKNHCKECSPPKCRQSITCAHYTQTIWSITTKVGCGQNKCKGRRGRYGGVLYCEYAPIGNGPIINGHTPRPYIEGTPCSQCPAGSSFCMDGLLCATKSACRSSKSECKCKLDPQSCQHGTFVADDCLCRCQPGWEGSNCDVVCQDEIPKEECDVRKTAGWCSWDNLGISRTKQDCRKTCNVCGIEYDMNSRNEAKITSQIMKLKLKLPNDEVSKYKKIIRGHCKNEHDDKKCDEWAKRGQCEVNPDGMVLYCASSCNKCKEHQKLKEEQKNSKDSSIPIQKGNCKNVRDDDSCDKLAGNGACQRNPDQMKTLCPASCNMCSTKDAVCEDKFGNAKCAKYKEGGYCTDLEQKSLMEYHCKKTCNKC